MHQLSEDLNLYIFNLTRNIDNFYNLIQLNKHFYALYIDKYKLLLQDFINLNIWNYNETVWFM